MRQMAADDRARRRGQPVAQPRPPARADRRARSLPRRDDPDHRRRPPGPARAAPEDDGGDESAGRRRGLWRARQPVRRDRVQARDRGGLLPAAVARDRRRYPGRHRRLPADEPPRARRLPRDARAGAVRPRHGRVDRVQAGAVRLRPAGALRRRDQISAEEDVSLRARRADRLLVRSARSSPAMSGCGCRSARCS